MKLIGWCMANLFALLDVAVPKTGHNSEAQRNISTWGDVLKYTKVRL